MSAHCPFFLESYSYLISRAHDVALSKQHKSISASDVFKALEMIQFGDLVGILQGDLQGKSMLITTGKLISLVDLVFHVSLS